MSSGQDEASGFGYRQTAASLVARRLPLLYLTLNVVDPSGQRHDRYELVHKLMQDARKLAEQRFQVRLAKKTGCAAKTGLMGCIRCRWQSRWTV